MSALLALFLAAATLFSTGKGAVTLPAGTILHTRLEQTIGTAGATEGQRITFRLTAPYPRDAAHLAGARISAYVTSVTRPARNRRARIGLVFARIFFSDGSAEPIAAYVDDASFTRREPEDFSPRDIGLTVTPGAGTPPMLGGYKQNPTLWQAKFGAKPPRPTGAYAYAERGGTELTLPENQAYDLELARGLTLP